MLFAAYLTPVVLWAASGPIEGRFATPFAALTSLAVICGLVGTCAFAMNLVLGARLRPVEALFGGLGAMYAAHRRNGQLAFALLLGHVVLMLASRATLSPGAALALLGPGAGWTVFAGVIAFAAMTTALGLTLLVRLGHEVFVYVQRAFGVIFLVAAYHVFTTPGAKASSPALTWYMAAIATLGIAGFAYRSLFSSVLVRRFRYRVQAVNRLDPAVTEVVMEPMGRRLVFAPGQYVFVTFRSAALAARFNAFEISRRGGISIRPGEIANQFHPFSITSPPDAAFRITAKAVGDYTRALRELEVGAEAIIEGPYGSFTQEASTSRHQVWIAGGIGVTPFLSMARSFEPGEEASIHLYYCVETEREALFLEELQALSERHRGFRVQLVPRDEAGFITASRIANETGDLASRDVFLCGPPGMLASLTPQLLDQGVPRSRIHAEEFSFARVAS